MSDSPVSRSVSIRLADHDDWTRICKLFSQRDGRPWDVSTVQWMLCNLDPERCLAWLAIDGEMAVGFSSVFVRHLVWQGQPHRVAYWHNLYVDPGYREFLLYPRLPMAMFTHVRGGNFAFLYGSVRRRDVAQAHLSIGFKKCGAWPVLMQLLRPGRLLAKHRDMRPGWHQVIRPLDAGYSLVTSAWRPHGVTAVQDDLLTGSNRAAQMIPLVNQSAAQLVAQQWTDEQIMERYRRTAEGTEYRLAAISDEAGLRAAVIYRFAERGNEIRSAVVMDAATRADAESELVGLLQHVSAQARTHGCELVLALGGMPRPVDKALRRCGFRVAPEQYDLLIWPASALKEHPWCADFHHWRFAFGDHDAF